MSFRYMGGGFEEVGMWVLISPFVHIIQDEKLTVDIYGPF